VSEAHRLEQAGLAELRDQGTVGIDEDPFDDALEQLAVARIVPREERRAPGCVAGDRAGPRVQHRLTEAFPSIVEYGRGEILLTRTITHGDQGFMFGDPKGFPREAKPQIEDMVLDKLFYFDERPTFEAQFEAFMKLGGPYWMSCVTKNEKTPILAPDHYKTYLDDHVERIGAR
jgi:hypothetical protein